MRPFLLCLILTAAPALAQTRPADAPPAAPPAATAGALAEAPAAPYVLDPLPYGFDALAPVIDSETMRLHWGAHHRAYVDNLNRAVAADPALAKLSLEELMARMSTLPAAIRNNGGGHWNHRFFWPLMTAPGTGGQPSPRLLDAISRAFGSFPAFRRAFEQAGLRQFGSGWVWLVVRPDGTLAIATTPNQDNPLMDLAETRGTPILGNDLWEHAYYLSYRNRRGEYLQKWWEVVNWTLVSQKFDDATRAQ